MRFSHKWTSSIVKETVSSFKSYNELSVTCGRLSDYILVNSS